jgi:putative membrane protein
MMGGFGFGMPVLFGGLMMLPILALPVLFILGLGWLLMTLWRGSPITSLSGSQTPQDILNARYARGEINKEQYEEMRQRLGV